MDDIKPAQGGATASGCGDTVQGIIQRLEIAITLAKERAAHAERERDMLANRCVKQARRITTLMTGEGRRLTVSAAEAVAAVMARADDDGAFHRDAMVEVLRCLGAR